MPAPDPSSPALELDNMARQEQRQLQPEEHQQVHQEEQQQEQQHLEQQHHEQQHQHHEQYQERQHQHQHVSEHEHMHEYGQQHQQMTSSPPPSWRPPLPAGEVHALPGTVQELSRKLLSLPGSPQPDRCEVCGEDLIDVFYEARASHRQACAQLAAQLNDQDDVLDAAVVKSDADAAMPTDDIVAADARGAVAQPTVGSPAKGGLAEAMRAMKTHKIHAVNEAMRASPDTSSGMSAGPRPWAWRLAASGLLDPVEYTCAALADFVPVPTCTERTEEGLRCATCSHYIKLSHGAAWDEHGEPCCAACAQHRHLPAQPRLASTTAALPRVDVRAALQSDLRSAVLHLERLARRDPARGKELYAGLGCQGLALEDVAARGVLCAYTEAEELCEGCVDASQVAYTMVRDWDAQVPSSLLMLLLLHHEQAVVDAEPEAVPTAHRHAPAGHAHARRLPCDGGRTSLRDEVRRARLRCAEQFVAEGLRV